MRRSLTRQLLRHAHFFDTQFRPMANGLSKPAFDACHIVHSQRVRRLLQPYPAMPTLSELVRQTPPDDLTAVEALRGLAHIRERLDATEHKSLVDVPYQLNVGDVVRHSTFDHIGVVAARLPVCFEPDEWVLENLGSLDDKRMYHPWYLVLVSQHMGLPPHFVRFGSQLTHTRVESSIGIGFHNMLPTFFKGFDAATGRYIPRFDTDASRDLSATTVGGCAVPRAEAPVGGPACKLPAKRRTALAKS